MTHWALWIAAIWPWCSAWRSRSSVTTVAYLITLKGFPSMSKTGL